MSIGSMLLAAAVTGLAFGVALPAAVRAAEPAAAASSSGSMIQSLSYDPATQTLTVVMTKDGRVCKHLRVPEKVYKDFKNAKSKGTFYLLYIRGKYEMSAK